MLVCRLPAVRSSKAAPSVDSCAPLWSAKTSSASDLHGNARFSADLRERVLMCTEEIRLRQAEPFAICSIRNVGNFVAVEASRFLKVQYLSTGSRQQIQRQALRTCGVQQSSIGSGIWLGTRRSEVQILSPRPLFLISRFEIARRSFWAFGRCRPAGGGINSGVMPSGLRRYHQARREHYLTWSCYRRRALLGTARRRDVFLSVLEQVRRRYRFVVMGYVVMPEHVHLLIGEPEHRTVAKVMQVLKQRTARRLLPRRRAGQASLWEEEERFWQKRYYDFNVWSERKRVEKLRYMHQNPVRRGLVDSVEMWVWSSYRVYALGTIGPVKLNEWPEMKIHLGSRS
jgi:putative transposase